MATWLELRDTVRRSGRIDQALVERIAVARAEHERDHFAAMGIPQPWERLLEHERALTEQVAKAALDDLAAARMLAAVSPAERAARQFDLKAEIAETAIPPRPSTAALYRECAAECRAASYLQAAE